MDVKPCPAPYQSENLVNLSRSDKIQYLLILIGAVMLVSYKAAKPEVKQVVGEYGSLALISLASSAKFVNSLARKGRLDIGDVIEEFEILKSGAVPTRVILSAQEAERFAEVEPYLRGTVKSIEKLSMLKEETPLPTTNQRLSGIQPLTYSSYNIQYQQDSGAARRTDSLFNRPAPPSADPLKDSTESPTEPPVVAQQERKVFSNPRDALQY